MNDYPTMKYAESYRLLTLIVRAPLLVLTILISNGFATAKEASSKAPPNFIILYVDDLGWADTSVRMMDSDPDSKSDFHQTPNLEYLAEQGMRFSNAYAPAPTCTPSRLSIQMGKTPARLGCRFVNDVVAYKKALSWGDEVSMADILKASGKGYVTSHFGKGMAKDYMKTVGYDITDEYDIGPNGNFHGDYVDIKSRTPLPAEDPKRMNSLEASSVEFLKEYSGKQPFFMMVSHYAVHVPHAADPKLIEKYRKLPRGKHCKDADYVAVDQISHVQATGSWRLQYAAMIEQMDHHLGALIEVLKETDQFENTYVIYTSDNGGGLGPNGSLYGFKATMFEGGLRVPFVVSGPGVSKGSQCDEPIVQWDLLPTLHDFSGSPSDLPKDLDGGSLRSVFSDGNKGSVERPVEGMVFHYPCYFAAPISAVRLGAYKYMKHLLTGETKLFNLEEDYSEKNDLSAELPEKVAEMERILSDYLNEIDAEDMDAVYAARIDQINGFENQATINYYREVSKLDLTRDRTKIDEVSTIYKNCLARFKKNKEEVARNRVSTRWIGRD